MDEPLRYLAQSTAERLVWPGDESRLVSTSSHREITIGRQAIASKPLTQLTSEIYISVNGPSIERTHAVQPDAIPRFHHATRMAQAMKADKVQRLRPLAKERTTRTSKTAFER